MRPVPRALQSCPAVEGHSLLDLDSGFFYCSGATEVQERQECQYGENCTFAYCQEEIDVWTQERKGALSRELLFDPLGSTERRALSVTRLLQLHMGMFMFLCEVRHHTPSLQLLFTPLVFYMEQNI